ncbi:MAG: two-component system, cell cycle response regulator [Methanolobus sp.]|jgi:two-component system cell cycle response regulator|nr:two-component system, cell cycle response regulator [Methanolobus sp.]
MDEHKKGKVLIVDDESMNVKLLDAYLMHEYEIISAYGGIEALEKVEAHNPDIIFLDLMMPDITGYEVCKILKGSEKTRFIPIIMVTALSSLEDRIKGIDAGADDFLTKPLDRLEIKTRVGSLLRIKKLHDELISERDQAQNYLDLAGVMLFVLDENGIVKVINRKGCEILGYREDEILGNDWFENYVPELFRENARKGFEKLLSTQTESTGYFEVPFLNSNKQKRIMSWTNIVLHDSEGGINSLLVSGEDITERIEAESKIKRANEYLDNLLKASPIAILALDSKKRVVTANRNAADLLGYEVSEIIARPIREFVDDSDLLEFTDKNDFEMVFYTKHEEKVRMNVSTSLLPDDGGKEGLVITLQDRSRLRGLFITPLTEDIEEDSDKADIELESGYIYLSGSENPGQSYNAFSELVKSGKPGLCITRMNPDKIRSMYGIAKTPIVWLTKNKIAGQQSIDSTELFRIHPTIADFVNKVEDGVVLMDGLEYLILDNDFLSVVKLLEQTNDTIMASSSRMVLQLDPDILEKKEFHLLKRWMRPVAGDAPSLDKS